MPIYEKVDDKTVRVTTTTEPVESVESEEEFDRAELQTELDHIPDRKDEIQKQLDDVCKRETELKTILSVFNVEEQNIEE